MRRLIQIIVDGYDEIEGVGGNAGQRRRRKWMQILYTLLSDASCQFEVEAPSKVEVQR